jgi:hypothetical protein
MWPFKPQKLAKKIINLSYSVCFFGAKFHKNNKEYFFGFFFFLKENSKFEGGKKNQKTFCHIGTLFLVWLHF